LQALEKARRITDLKRQVPFALHCPMFSVSTGSAEVCKYVADYTYLDEREQLHVVDAKGVRTPLYRLKAKWLQLEYGITIEEI
jgi:hypothetical protein